MVRPIAALPKAHLHLHLVGSLRATTLRELAAARGMHLPAALADADGSGVPLSGWLRFQRLYDCARDVLRTRAHIERLFAELAEDEAAAGSGWAEVQVTLGPYAQRFGGLVPAIELLLEAAEAATAASGVGLGLILAANRIRPPWEAVTLARLAVRYAGAGVIGFGLSNDERMGPAEDFEQAFRIARSAGLLSVPHAGEFVGPASIRASLERLGADRIGHGVRAVDDPELLERLVQLGTVLEVCPASNVALGVVPSMAEHQLPALVSAGVAVALGADDPLLFGAHLLDAYQIARDHFGIDDAGLAALAATSISASAAPIEVKTRLLAGVRAWLASYSADDIG